MNCEQVKGMLVNYLDNGVDAEEKASIEAHLTHCPDCMAEMEALFMAQNDFRQTMQESIAGLAPPAHALVAIKQRIAHHIPILSSVKARIAKWWRGVRTRPAWQQACILIPMAAVLITPSAAAVGNAINTWRTHQEFLASFNIYVMDADGSNVTQLTDDDLWNGSFSFSPDDSKIVFCSGSGPRPYGDHDVYIMDADGSNMVQLTDTDGDDLMSKFSPDGTKILFSSWRDTPLVYREDIPYMPDDASGFDSTMRSIDREKSGKGDIYIMDIDGSNVTRITETADVEERHLIWSPDGTQIAFYTDRFIRGEDESTFKQGIHVINADGTGLVNIVQSVETTHIVRSDDGPTTFNREQDTTYNLLSSLVQWSPGGTQLLFAANHIDNGYGIYLANADASGITDITPTSIDGYLAYPKWSPDGTRISFLGPFSDINEARGECSIYTINMDGSNLTQVADDMIYPESGYWWSPDSSRIAYTAEPELDDFYDGHEIFIVNADGTNNARLTNNDYPDLWPVWSKTGTKLIFFKAAKRYTPGDLVTSD